MFEMIQSDIQKQRLERKHTSRNIKNNKSIEQEIHQMCCEAYNRKCNLLCTSDEYHGKYTTLFYGGMHGSHGTDILHSSLLIRERDFRFIEVCKINGMKRIVDHGYMNIGILFEKFPQYLEV
jgi:hypothetical protein